LLLELRVRNLGIIESIDWNLRSGLNVITGDTGAGKSLVIEAVEMLLEGKVADEVIRHGSDIQQKGGMCSSLLFLFYMSSVITVRTYKACS